MIKNKKQIEGIKRSCTIASRTLDYLDHMIKEGVTTKEINDAADSFIRDCGAIPACLGYNGFPASICTSVNDVVCHGIPSDVKLYDGDILNVDVTTILDGYFGDTSRMFIIGNVPQSTTRLVQCTKTALDLAIDSLKPGKMTGCIGHVIGNFAKESGYSVVEDYCGHGTGLVFHEDLQILHECDEFFGEILLPGMIFTIEPMFNVGSKHVYVDPVDRWTVRTIDGKLSAQYEHTVLITDDGCDVLTISE